jgi:hypothetical protein
LGLETKEKWGRGEMKNGERRMQNGEGKTLGFVIVLKRERFMVYPRWNLTLGGLFGGGKYFSLS